MGRDRPRCACTTPARIHFRIMSRGNRTADAFLVAGPVALSSWVGFLFIYTMLFDGVTRAALLVPYLLMGAVLAGVPLVLAVLLVAWPLSAVLRRTVGLSLPLVLAAGCACGLLARRLAVLLWAQPEAGFLPVPVVLLTGATAAWAWWRVWATPARPLSAHRGAL